MSVWVDFSWSILYWGQLCMSNIMKYALNKLEPDIMVSWLNRSSSAISFILIDPSGNQLFNNSCLGKIKENEIFQKIHITYGVEVVKIHYQSSLRKLSHYRYSYTFMTFGVTWTKFGRESSVSILQWISPIRLCWLSGGRERSLSLEVDRTPVIG